MNKVSTWYYVVNKSGEQISAPTKNYETAKLLLQYCRQDKTNFYTLESYLDEEEESDKGK